MVCVAATRNILRSQPTVDLSKSNIQLRIQTAGGDDGVEEGAEDVSKIYSFAEMSAERVSSFLLGDLALELLLILGYSSFVIPSPPA